MKRVHIRDCETGATHTIDLGARTKPGWNELVLGWSTGEDSFTIRFYGRELWAQMIPDDTPLTLWRVRKIASVDQAAEVS